MKQKPSQIRITCSRGIALEMCRYDGSIIVKETLINNHYDAVLDRNAERLGLDVATLEQEKERHRIYEFTIEGIRHTVARYASFGVQVTKI